MLLNCVPLKIDSHGGNNHSGVENSARGSKVAYRRVTVPSTHLPRLTPGWGRAGRVVRGGGARGAVRSAEH